MIRRFYEGNYHATLRVPGGTEKAFYDKFTGYRNWALQFITRGRALDIGTATGLFPSLLKEAGFDAEGLEINEASARWGETQYGVRIRVGTLEASGFDRHSYDFISMTDVLEHMTHPLRFLLLVSEYLKPGGLVLVTFPDINSVESRYLHLLAWMLRRHWIWSCCGIPAHIWEFTPATAQAMFHKAGFEVLGYRRWQPQEGPWAGILSVLRAPIRLLNAPGIGRLLGTNMQFMIRKRDARM